MTFCRPNDSFINQENITWCFDLQFTEGFSCTSCPEKGFKLRDWIVCCSGWHDSRLFGSTIHQTCAICNSRGDIRQQPLTVAAIRPQRSQCWDVLVSLLWGTRLCCAPQHWPVKGTRGDEVDCFWMKKSAHSVPLVQGTGAGLGVGRRVWMSVWPRSWHYTLTFPLRLNCFKVLNRKKKRKSGRLSHHPPVEKVLQTCRWDSEKQDKRNRQGHRRTGRCLTDREHESDRHTNRQTESPQRDGQASCWKAFAGSSPGYINSSSSGFNLLPAS